MPNHYYNRLSVIGRQVDVDKFVEAAVGKRCKYKPAAYGLKHQNQSEIVSQSLCYNALLPVPDGIKAQTYSDGGYRWQIDNWGVKWEASEVEGPDVSVTPMVASATWYFYSPNGKPCRLFNKMAQEYPTLFFLNSWGGEDPTRGQQWRRGGKSSVVLEDDSWRSIEDVEDEDEQSRLFDAWETAILDSHIDTVEALVDVVNELASDFDRLRNWLYSPGDAMVSQCLCVVENDIVSAYAIDHLV